MSVYDITFTDNLPSKGISDIPPTDTILPSIFAKIQNPPPSSSLPTPAAPTEPTEPTASTTQTAKSAKSAKSIQSLPTQSPKSLQSSLYFQDVVSSQQCFDYAKNCRDVQCAFEDFSVICDNKGNGPTCTCGTGQTSNASSSIRSNAHFAILTIFISFVISFYQFC